MALAISNANWHRREIEWAHTAWPPPPTPPAPRASPWAAPQSSKGRRRRTAGRLADFFQIAPGPILSPRGGQNRIPRGKIFRFHPFS